MTTNAVPHRTFVFGPFCLDLTERVLSRGGRIVPLGPKIVETLILLVENAGRVVGKDEMMERLWGETFVEESSLSQNIFLLRKALRNGSGGHEFIETIPKRGYRFAPEAARPTNGRGDSIDRVNTSEPRSGSIRSLAVMPFALLREENNGNKSLGLAMADAAIHKLSGLPDLTVIPTRTMMKYAERAEDLWAVVREQGVDAVVEGSVQRSNKKVRVCAQLISAADGLCVWSGKFEEPLDDIFAIQDLISERLAKELAVELNGSGKLPAGKRGTRDPQAYEACLMGFYFANRKTKEALNTSIDYFERSIKLDPLFARAYAGMADSRFWLAHGSTDTHFRYESFEASRANALKAINLDDTLAEAHAALGTVLVKHDRDPEGADRAFREGIGADPNSAMAFSRYAYFLAAMGRIDEALEMIERSREIDPLSPDANASLAMVLHFLGRHDEAIGYCQTALAIEPNFSEAELLLGRCFEEKQMFTEAEAAYTAAVEKDPSCLENRELLAHFYAATGRANLARTALSTLLSPAAKDSIRPYNIAAIYATLGEHTEAAEWIERPHINWTERLRWLRYDPRLDGLRSSSRSPLVDDCKEEPFRSTRKAGQEDRPNYFRRQGNPPQPQTALK